MYTWICFHYSYRQWTTGCALPQKGLQIHLKQSSLFQPQWSISMSSCSVQPQWSISMSSCSVQPQWSISMSSCSVHVSWDLFDHYSHKVSSLLFLSVSLVFFFTWFFMSCKRLHHGWKYYTKLQKLIYLYLFTDCFMKSSLQWLEQI